MCMRSPSPLWKRYAWPTGRRWRIRDSPGNVIDDETLRGRYFELCNREDDEAVQKEWGRFCDDLWAYVDGMGLERQATWFIELNDPITIKGHYWVHDGVEYLDAAHTLPRFED